MKDKDVKSVEETKKRMRYVSFILNAEPVYRHGDLIFCIYDKNGSWTFREEIESDTEIIRPSPVLKVYAEKGYAFLPSEPEEYGDTLKLADEIYKFLYKYIDYPDEYRHLDVWYAFFTWIYDKFPILPYRRALGSTGRGKSRWVKVLGSICRLAFIQGAATSPASVFRLSDAIRGTQIIDENYFSFKTEVGQAIVLTLNSGYDKTMGFVTRCVGENHVPTPFCTFGPKLIASCHPFPDEATENRTITHIAYETDRTDIPIHLKEDFWRESLKLRNKLLLWRFRNLNNEYQEDEEFLRLKINPRLKEVLAPITAVTRDENVREWLKKLAFELSTDIAEIRSETTPATALKAILALRKEGVKKLQVKDIAEKIKQLNPDYPLSVTPKSIGSILRRELGLKTRREQIEGRAPYVLVWDEKAITRLAKSYGLERELSGLTSLTCLTSLTSCKEEKKEGEATYPKVKEVIEVKEVKKISLEELLTQLRARQCFWHWTEFVKVTQTIDPSYSEEDCIRLFRRLGQEGKLAMTPEGAWVWVKQK